MIDPKAATDASGKFKYSMIDREAESFGEDQRASTVICEPAPVSPEFDLFAEARQIYVRARSGRRVRSSSII